MKVTKIIGLSCVLMGALFFVSCGESGSGQVLDTPTTGHIRISADESLRPIVEQEVSVFESLYPKAKIDVIYTGEKAAIDTLLADSARLCIVTRDLIDAEKSVLESQTITPRTIPMATDALAILLHPNNPDTLYSQEQMNAILSGTYQDWKQVSSKQKSAPIRIVFDHPQSGAARYIRDSIIHGNTLPANCYALKNNPEVVQYVAQHPEAIGIIGMSWISNENNREAMAILHQVRTADIIPTIKPAQMEQLISFKPCQYNIALKIYPYLRKIQIISRESRTGLGTGFASFIAGDQGQRIIEKAGLIPAKAAIRVVQITQ